MLTLWNTYSFWVLYSNAEGLGPDDVRELSRPEVGSSRNGSPTAELDRWALSRLQGTIRTVIERLDAYDCTTAGQAIGDYVEELSNWYVRLSRRRFWDGDRAAFATLRHCLLTVAALLAPFTPFLAEEIYLNLAGGEAEDFGPQPDSVHLLDFPEPDASLEDR
jgi:isoleucyl-tRNA synthetase